MTRAGACRGDHRSGKRRCTLALCAVLEGCAIDTITPETPKTVHEQPITPFATHEECVQLAVGDRLDFAFTTTEAVDFDLRYREAGATLIPLSRAQTQEFSAIFAPTFAQRYCLAWEAGRDGALLDYRIQVHRPTVR